MSKSIKHKSMNTESSRNLTRREFLSGAVGVGILLNATGFLDIPKVFAANTRKTGMLYRTLGRTKQKISVVGIGTVQITNPAIIHRALDYGVNYIDTAECYGNGENEKMVGEVLKKRRTDAFVCTKWHVDSLKETKQQLIESVDGSLRRLGIDTIDLIATHGADKKEQVEYPAIREAFLELKKAGKVRFLGFSHHSMNPTLLRYGIKTGWYDAIFMAYNFMAGKEVIATVAEAKKAGIGIVTMKSVVPTWDAKANEFFGKIDTTPAVAAIKWVINDPNVTTCGVGMTSFEQVDEDLKAVGKPLRKVEAETLWQFAAAIDSSYCRMCGVCTNHCPQGIAVADIMRCSLYHDAYKDTGLARSTYASIPVTQRLSQCTQCGTCKAVCPYGIAVTQRLQQAAGYLRA